MNLNLNPRCEQFEITDDPDRMAMFMEFVDTVFNELREGDTEDRKLPPVKGMTAVQPDLGIEITPTIKVGKWVN
jgi:hypothetical protein